jgi:murein DD-endopeptidase MepM/ murein hydrolase activator NlpD
MSVDVRTAVQGASVATVAGALLIGVMSPAIATQDVPGPLEEIAGEMVESEEPDEPEFPFAPGDMAAAARQAKKIEAQRAKRAAARAQRSSGPMFTPTTNFDYSARFGQPGGWSSGYHTGLDFAAPSGTPVFSALAGTVVESGWGGAYGNHLIIKHSNGVKTLYAHLTSAKVSKGDKVLRGQTIGTVGSTGNSTGPHLHFEVIKGGTQRNPAAFL